MKKILLLCLILLTTISIVVTFSISGCKAEPTVVEEVAEEKEEAAVVEEETAAVEEVVEVAEEVVGIDLGTLGIKENGEPYKIAWCGAIIQHEWALSHKAGLEKAVEVFGCEVEVLGPSDMALEGMVTALENAKAKEVDLILHIPLHEALGATVDSIVDGGIPVVFLDIDYPQTKRSFFVGVELDKAWKKAAEIIAEKVNYEGEFIYFELPGNDSSHRMRVAFDSVIENYPDIKIVEVIDTEADQAKGVTKTVAALQAHPEVKAIISFEGTTAAAALAVRELGYEPGEIIVSGVDLFGETKNLILADEIYGTVFQPQATESFTAIMIWLMSQNNIMGTDSLTKFYLPYTVYVDAGYLTKEDLQ